MFGTQTRNLRARPTNQAKPVKEVKKRSVLGDVEKDTKKAAGKVTNGKQAKVAQDVAKPATRLRSRKSSENEDNEKQVKTKRVLETKPQQNVRASTNKQVVVAQPIKKVKTSDHDDLDLEDMHDPMMVSEYVEEIFEYLRELEMQTLPNENYMDSQKELQWKMRSILVDWLIEVHVKFRLLPETLYLAVNIIDRFLSLRVVSLVKLQLVGLTSLFIASKYEEVVSPSIQNFLYMAEDGYTEDEIVRAERYVLQVLKFNLRYPTPMSFLRRSSKADDYDIQTRTLAKYLMEITLLDESFLKIPASLIAASAHYFARHMLNRGLWDKNLIYYSGYSEKEMTETVSLMIEFLKKPIKYEAIFKKYSQRKFMKGAIFVKDWIKNNSRNLHPQKDHALNMVSQSDSKELSQMSQEESNVDECSEAESDEDN